ncbi:MAG: DUF5104 domain-containing protein [Lachnospiraceae bacterium]|nr:DUF5104 domain-containing protein [Lachnospiraceae bacterium]
MRKRINILTIIFAMLILVNLTGCFRGRYEVMEDMTGESAELIENARDKIIDGINKNDIDAIKSLFADIVFEETDDVDEKLSGIIELFAGRKIISTTDKKPGFQKDTEGKLWTIYNAYDLTLEDGSVFIMNLSLDKLNEEDPSSIGVNSLAFCNCIMDATPDEFDWEGEGLIRYFGFYDKPYEEAMKTIINAINNTDAEAIKALLSENAKEYIFDVDTDIQWLFDAFYGKKIVGSECIRKIYENTYSSRHDVQVSNRWSRIYVLTLEDGTEYEMKISMYSMDKEDPGNVGLNVLKVLTTTQEQRPDASDVHWDSWVGDPAIESITI